MDSLFSSHFAMKALIGKSKKNVLQFLEIFTIQY